MNDQEQTEIVSVVEECVIHPTPELNLADLLKAESEVLRRVGQLSSESQLGSHFSNTGGHNSSGSHSSHTSAKNERPLED